MAKSILSNLDFGGVAKITSLPSPSASGDAATKGYVDSAIEGLSWKDSVRAASTANVTLASPGATMDGITLVSGDRVLLKDQTTAAQNGVYVWTGSAVALTRAYDCTTSNDLEQAITTVEEGTANAASSWRQTSVNFVIDTGAVAWTAFGTVAPAASTSTAGIVALATQTEVNAGAVTNKVVTPATLAAYANGKLKYTTTVGDGSATSFTLTHNLNTYDVMVEVYKAAGNRDEVICDVTRPSVNSVNLIFASAPAAGAYAAVVLG